jgi:hypothetical protein
MPDPWLHLPWRLISMLCKHPRPSGTFPSSEPPIWNHHGAFAVHSTPSSLRLALRPELPKASNGLLFSIPKNSDHGLDPSSAAHVGLDLTHAIFTHVVPLHHFGGLFLSPIRPNALGSCCWQYCRRFHLKADPSMGPLMEVTGLFP